MVMTVFGHGKDFDGSCGSFYAARGFVGVDDPSLGLAAIRYADEW